MIKTFQEEIRYKDLPWDDTFLFRIDGIFYFQDYGHVQFDAVYSGIFHNPLTKLKFLQYCLSTEGGW
jgi:hypothetical protein